MQRSLLKMAITLALAMLIAPISSESAQTPSGDLLSKGLWWMYHLQYDKAYASFGEYVKEHPGDPEGHFYQAATDWWHLAQDFDYSLPEIQNRFFANADLTIAAARSLAEKTTDPKVRARAYLYWGGAEGLRGRWLVTQKKWVKAYFAGKDGEHFLRLALKYDPTLYDAYMGLGIYDYFTDTLGGVVGALSALFIHGDKVRGLQELQLAIEKGSHARVEAQIFLIEIYTSEENQPEKALPIAKALHEEFPLSPAMHLAKVMALYGMKDWDRLIQEADDFRERSEEETPYYQKKGVRPALYCLGVAYLWGRHDFTRALKFFQQIIDQDLDESRWVTFALLRRGQILDSRGERAQAQEDYRRVLKRADFWGAHREAKQGLQKPVILFSKPE